MGLRGLLVFISLIFVANFLGIWEGWYWTLSWYDIVLHLAGGLWVGFLFFYLFGKRLVIFDLKEHPSFSFIFLLGFTALFGVLWEFYEYLADVFLLAKYPFTAQGKGVFDTLKDLFNGLVGAIFAFGTWRYRER